MNNLEIFMAALIAAAVATLLNGCAGGIIDIDRLRETNQDVYGCVKLDVAARGGNVNLILIPKGQPLPPDVKIPTC